MFKMSSTNLHVLSQPLSETLDSFVNRTCGKVSHSPVRVFKSKTVFGVFIASDEPFKNASRVSLKIRYIQGIQNWRVGWPLFF